MLIRMLCITHKRNTKQMIYGLIKKSMCCVLLPLLVYNDQITPHTGAPGWSFVPGGQQVGVADHPVTAAGKAVPTQRTEGCREKSPNRSGSKPTSALTLTITSGPGTVQLTAYQTFAHVRTLISAQMRPPFPKGIYWIFDHSAARANLWITVRGSKL